MNSLHYTLLIPASIQKHSGGVLQLETPILNFTDLHDKSVLQKMYDM